jgi:hypothetical protein
VTEEELFPLMVKLASGDGVKELFFLQEVVPITTAQRKSIDVFMLSRFEYKDSLNSTQR